MSTISESRARVDAALARFGAGEAKLFDSDGKRLFEVGEHRRRHAALLAELKGAVDSAIAAAGEARAAAEVDKQAAVNPDPTGVLTGSELAEANARQTFVEEDAGRLPLPGLVKRVEAVLAEGSRSLIWLYGRYGRRRANELLARARASGKGLGQDAEDFHALTTMLDRLDATLRDPAEAAARITEAEAEIKAAGELEYHSRRALAQADGSLARAGRERSL